MQFGFRCQQGVQAHVGGVQLVRIRIQLRDFRLQISAANGASIHVRGAVWMDGTNTNVTVVDQQTPFDMETLGTVVNGILKVDGRDPIRVEVTDEATSTQTLSAEGHAIIVGQGLAPNSGWAFIRTER